LTKFPFCSMRFGGGCVAKVWAIEMSSWKPDQGECGERWPDLVRFARRRYARPSDRHKTSNRSRSFVLRIANFATLCALAFVGWGAGISHAQGSDTEKAGYADALSYCRGDVAHPMALRTDKRVLCLDGWIFSEQEISPANSLEQGGLFVVRNGGGDVATTIALANMLGNKHATVVVNDYCLATCADYLLIASAETIVPKDALVAWTNVRSGPNNCVGFSETPDHGAPRLYAGPCTDPLLEGRSEYFELIHLKDKFYKERIFAPPFVEPPESPAIRRILKRKFDATGRYPDEVFWTWNPRYYASAIRTKILYEAYPQSQDEVDAIVARHQLPYSVIYDP
jgi:hypothetical protein